MTSVKFGIGTTNYFNMPCWVAQHTGLFEKYGISLEPDVYLSIEEADEGLRSGRFPLAFQATEAVISAAEDGAPLKIIGGNLHAPAGIEKAFAGSFIDSFPGVGVAWAAISIAFSSLWIGWTATTRTRPPSR